MFFNQACFIYMCVLSHDVWILCTRVFYHMMFEWEIVGDFMHAFYYLSDFICLDYTCICTESSLN